MFKILLPPACLVVFLFPGCIESHVKEKKEWASYFERNGIKNGCFELRDHNHDCIYYYNLERCSKRFLPASTFKIFNSLAGLESGVANDDQYVIPWDSVHRKPEWDKDLTMNEAFKVSCVPYYRALAKKIGMEKMKYYIDTVRYGNMNLNTAIDSFWLNDTLKISPDEQIGFLKRMYFYELPFSERSQRIVKTMMLHDQTPAYNLYYKTGTGISGQNMVYWVVGFAEKIEHVKEDKASMNKSDYRYYPYFFAENFEVPLKDTSDEWYDKRIKIVHQLLKDYGAISE
jgi:beta-lactamase class D